jgi:hypothetical protein
MSEIKSPHDSFCKEIMSRLEVAADFMANYLPPDVVALLDLSGDEVYLQRRFGRAAAGNIQSVVAAFAGGCDGVSERGAALSVNRIA